MSSTDNLADERRRLQKYQVLRLLGMLWPCAVVLWVVPGRLFVAPDSTQYLSAARNLLAGNGLASYWWSGRPEPLTHFPPLFPLILALFGWVGLDMEQAALWLNLAALSTIVWQSSRLAGLLAGGSAVQRARVMAFCALAVGLAHDVTYVSAILFTECLFMALSLSAISALVRGLGGSADDAERFEGRAIALSGAFCALAALTRFVGLALIAACVLAILVQGKRGMMNRLRMAALFFVTASGPLGAWLMYNRLRHLNVSNRELALHPVSSGELRYGMLTVSHWLSPFIPWSLPRLILFALGCLFLATLGVALWRVGWRDLFRSESVDDPARFLSREQASAPRSSVVVLALLFVFSYSGLLITSISVADNSTPLDLRILSPLMPTAIVLVVGFAALLARRRSAFPGWSQLAAAISGTALGGIYLVSQALALVVWARTARAEGSDLNAIARAAPRMLARVSALPPEAVVYSNMPGLIYYFSKRVAIGLPWRYSPTSLLPNPRYAIELAGLSCHAAPTYVVVFKRGSDRTYVATLEDVESRQQFVTLDSMPAGYFGRVAPRTSRTLDQTSSQPPT